MRHDLRFQVAIMPTGTYDEIVKRFQHVEDCGFDMATTGDHFVDWTNPPAPWLEAWTTLAGVARDTQRIRLAHYVNQVPLRSPTMLARQALSLDHLSGGRFEVGLGTGLNIDPSYDMAGFENWSQKERVERLVEYVEIVDRMLSNEVSSYEGKYYWYKEAVMNPRPLQTPRPPIVIAALGPVMMRHTAKYADNWNTLSFADSFDKQLAETKERAERMDRNLAAINRDPADLRYSYQMFDPASRASGGMVTYYESVAKFEDMAESLIAAGMSELGLYYPLQDSQRDVFEQIGHDILPKLKARHSAG